MRKEGGDWVVFVLAMLDEAANCPWPCKANLHVLSLFHYHGSAVSLFSPRPPALFGATAEKGQRAVAYTPGDQQLT